MPSNIIQRINDDHAANQAHIAKQVAATGNRVIDRINHDHAAAQKHRLTGEKGTP